MKYITRTKGVQKKKQETILLARVSQKKKVLYARENSNQNGKESPLLLTKRTPFPFRELHELAVWLGDVAQGSGGICKGV